MSLCLHAGCVKQGHRHAGSDRDPYVLQRSFPTYDVQKEMMAFCPLLVGTLTISARKITCFFCLKALAQGLWLGCKCSAKAWVVSLGSGEGRRSDGNFLRKGRSVRKPLTEKAQGDFYARPLGFQLWVLNPAPKPNAGNHSGKLQAMGQCIWLQPLLLDVYCFGRANPSRWTEIGGI